MRMSPCDFSAGAKNGLRDLFQPRRESCSTDGLLVAGKHSWLLPRERERSCGRCFCFSLLVVIAAVDKIILNGHAACLGLLNSNQTHSPRPAAHTEIYLCGSPAKRNQHAYVIIAMLLLPSCCVCVCLIYETSFNAS